MTLALIYGGRSEEHDVSCVSAAGLLEALQTVDGITVVSIGIARDGRWYLQRSPTAEPNSAGVGLAVDSAASALVSVIPGDGLQAGGAPLPIDCVFPVVHGTTGEDGVLQGLLESIGVPYVGSGVAGSAIGMDKTRSKRLWEHAGLPVVPYLYLTAGDAARPGGLARLAEQVEASFGYPVFVKPNAGGSSVGVAQAAGREELERAVHEALESDRACLVEKALEVREIETAVLGNEDPLAFPAGEVIPTHAFYDYEAKYVDPDGARLEIPAALDEATARAVRELSIAAFRAVDAAGLARVDCFIERSTGSIYLNEINTLPGFTPISMYPKMAEAGGVPYRELLIRLIELARERFALAR